MGVIKKSLVLLLTLVLATSFLLPDNVTYAKEEEHVPQYRLRHTRTGEHFYTNNYKERDNLILSGSWDYEGINCLVPVKSDTPIYRLLKKSNGDHHYTANVKERDFCVAGGWTYEGIGWYSGGETPVYRLFNPAATAPGTHHYTSSADERDNLIKNHGWEYEGISWYGSPKTGFIDPNPPADKPIITPGMDSSDAVLIENAKKMVRDEYEWILSQAKGWEGHGITFDSINISKSFDYEGDEAKETKEVDVKWSAYFTKDDYVAYLPDAFAIYPRKDILEFSTSRDWRIEKNGVVVSNRFTGYSGIGGVESCIFTYAMMQEGGGGFFMGRIPTQKNSVSVSAAQRSAIEATRDMLIKKSNGWSGSEIIYYNKGIEQYYANGISYREPYVNWYTELKKDTYVIHLWARTYDNPNYHEGLASTANSGPIMWNISMTDSPWAANIATGMEPPTMALYIQQSFEEFLDDITIIK